MRQEITRFISDIHLGLPHTKLRQLAVFLDRVHDGKITTDTLVINGDLLDSHQHWLLRGWARKVLDLLQKLSQKMHVVWIAGNHDPSMQKLSAQLGVEFAEQQVFESAGQRLLCIHGHQWDNVTANVSGCIMKMFDVGWSIMQSLSEPWADFFRMRSRLVKKVAARVRKGSVLAAHEVDASMVVTGHSHREELSRFRCGPVQSPMQFANLGSWLHQRFFFGKLHAGRLSLEEFKP